MRDLEIRGAGNLLGEEQSGHVAAVGFELYVGMLDEAVRLLRGRLGRRGGRAGAHGPARWTPTCPGDYVPYEAAKIEIHRRVAGAREIADLIMLREELEDRFGPVPEPLDNLIRLQDARIKLGRAGARTVDFNGGRLSRWRRSSSTRAGQGPARARCRRRSTSPGAARCGCGVPEDAAERFPAVVAAAEAILETATGADIVRRIRYPSPPRRALTRLLARAPA